MSVRVWTKSLVVIAAVAGAAAAMADDMSGNAWTYNFGATTDYRFRGISRSDNDPAMHGKVQYNDASGLFGSVWASTIDLQPFGDGDASVEIDLTAGYRYEFSSETVGTAKIVYYWFPDSDSTPVLDDADYLEFIAGLTHDFGDVSLSGELAYSPDFSRGFGDSFAITAGAAAPLMPTWWVFDRGLTASGRLGRQIFDEASDYTYWDLGVSAGAGVFTVDVRYVDTSINSCGNVCDAGLVLSASVALGN